MTYKEKCIRVIELAYSENFSEEELYYLLFDVVKANALKKKLFVTPDYYDDFCHHMSAALYMRLVDKTKTPIKSISNYINTTLRGFYDDFAKYEFSQIIDPKYMENEAEVRYGLDEYIKSQMIQSDDDSAEMYLNEYMSKMPFIIKHILEESGYTSDKKLLKNLYHSILLSMIYGKETNYRLSSDTRSTFSLILTDIKSRVNKDIATTLKSDAYPVDDLSYILYNMEVNDE